MIEVCLLGCGGMMPLPERRLTSLLFRHNGKMILIDCGEGTQVGIKLAGWGFKAIDAVCFTHYHADHIVGLPGFLLTLGNSGREEPLTIIGPPLLLEVIKGLTIITPELPYDIKLIELSAENETMNQVGDIIIRSIPVNHWVPCFAYSLEIQRVGRFNLEKARHNGVPQELWNRLQKGESAQMHSTIFTPEMVLGEARKGIKVSYCTDSRPTEDLAPFINNSDLFICEGMYGEEDKLDKAVEKKHMIFSEAAELARKGNVKELWLTHFSPSLNDPDQYIVNAQNIFENSYIGKDLMAKTIKFED